MGPRPAQGAQDTPGGTDATYATDAPDDDQEQCQFNEPAPANENDPRAPVEHDEERAGEQADDHAREREAAAETERPIRVIRRYCLSCTDGSRREVRHCTGEDCPLHPYRFGARPRLVEKWRKKLTTPKSLLLPGMTLPGKD